VAAVEGLFTMDDQPHLIGGRLSGAGERPDPYDRRTAAFPATVTTADKYWPPVGRIDAAHGDKNLVCACPDINDYA